MVSIAFMGGMADKVMVRMDEDLQRLVVEFAKQIGWRTSKASVCRVATILLLDLRGYDVRTQKDYETVKKLKQEILMENQPESPWRHPAGETHRPGRGIPPMAVAVPELKHKTGKRQAN